MHDEKGEYKPTLALTDKVIKYLYNKIEENKEDITITRAYHLDDAELVLIAYGCSARSALGAMEVLRAKGVKAGILQLITVWPLAEKEIRRVLSTVKTVVIPELNLGQIAGEVKKLNDYGCTVIQVNRVDGVMISPQDIINTIEEVMR
jgi:2-oxoglutarate ferredoxin oxidoreductase subunit alpha